METLEGEYRGERIFFIGNGPSLAETPIERLDGEFTFALNRIDSLYEDTEWRPSFYYNQWGRLEKRDRKAVQFHLDFGIPCFLNEEQKGRFTQRENLFPFETKNLVETSFPEESVEDLASKPTDRLTPYWSTDPTDLICTHHSMLGMMQLAFYMGFEEIYLVGTDLGFTNHRPHMIFETGVDPFDYDDKWEYLRDCRGEGVLGAGLANAVLWRLRASSFGNVADYAMRHWLPSKDPNHFSSGYRTRPQNHGRRNTDRQHIKIHTLAKRFGDRDGVDIYNATFGGELEVYPRVDFHRVLEQGVIRTGGGSSPRAQSSRSQ